MARVYVTMYCPFCILFTLICLAYYSKWLILLTNVFHTKTKKFKRFSVYVCFVYLSILNGFGIQPKYIVFVNFFFVFYGINNNSDCRNVTVQIWTGKLGSLAQTKSTVIDSTVGTVRVNTRFRYFPSKINGACVCFICNVLHHRKNWASFIQLNWTLNSINLCVYRYRFALIKEVLFDFIHFEKCFLWFSFRTNSNMIENHKCNLQSVRLSSIHISVWIGQSRKAISEDEVKWSCVFRNFFFRAVDSKRK